MGEILQNTEEILIDGNVYQVSYINSEIEVSGNKKSEVYTEIEINPKNSFTAKYKLIAVGNADLKTEIISRPLKESDTFTEIYSRALSVIDKETYLNIMYRGNSDVLTEIQPIGYNNIPTEIEVRPNNRMWALYEVQQPPIITDIFNPTQDSFTRENPAFESINYGSNSSIVVGRSEDEIWRSFVQFDLSSINPSYVLTESYLRLYYKGVVPENLKIEILNSDREWQEHNITNLNRPNPIRLISDEFIVNKENNYIEFNVLDIVKDWVALLQINNGFFIRISNETEFGQATFHTKESVLPPELVVKYYDSRIFSIGRSQQLTEIFVYKTNNSNIKTEITVDSAFSFSTHDTEIYVHRYEVPIPNDILAEIEVTKTHVHSEIIATIRDYLEANSEISVWNNKIDEIGAEIAVSRCEILTRIDSALRDYIESPLEISVTRPSIYIDIFVPSYKDSEVLTEIEINSLWFKSINTEITVSKENISTVIHTRVTRNKDLYTEISVTRPSFYVEVDVKTSNDILVEIEPNIKSDTLVEIISNKPAIESEISVMGYGNLQTDTEIFVSYLYEVETEITATAVNQIHVEIDVMEVNSIHTEITSSKNKVNTEIVIPIWIDHDVLTVIEPRILMVNNVYAIIQIGSVGGAYAFII